MNKTSLQWWNETKTDPIKLIDWLKDQYHGERTAAERIQKAFFTAGNTLTDKEASLVKRVIKEEKLHAKWVGKLLISRGITPEVLNKEERYWNKVTPLDNADKETLAAIGTHAETMRLERIKVIASDKTAPNDIREVFKRILKMEEGHVKIFSSMTTSEHLHKTQDNHQAGLNALGLII